MISGDSCSGGEHVHGAQSSLWQTAGAKSMAVRSEGGSRRVQSVISGDSCSEIVGFRAREGAKSVVLRGTSHLAPAVSTGPSTPGAGAAGGKGSIMEPSEAMEASGGKK